MKKLLTGRVLIWIVFLLGAIIFAIVLSSCFGVGSRPPGPVIHDPVTNDPVATTPASTLSSLAIYATWAAGIGLIGCGIAAAFLPNKLQIAKAALGFFAILITAGILQFIAAHWAVVVGLCAGVLLLCGIGYLFIHRKQVKKTTGIDLNWLCKPIPIKKPVG